MAIATNPPTFVPIQPIFCDVYVSDRLIIGGVLCLNDNRIVRDTYLGFVGDLAIIDTQGEDDPLYQGLGSRWILTWWPPAGSTAQPLVVPIRAVPNQTLVAVLGGQQARINIYAKQIQIPTGPLGSVLEELCLPSVTFGTPQLPPPPPPPPPPVFGPLQVAAAGWARIVVQKLPPTPPYGPPQVVGTTATTTPISTLATLGGPLVVLVAVGTVPFGGGSPPGVQPPVIGSVDGSAAGVTFTRRTMFNQLQNDNSNGYSASTNVAMEVWAGVAAGPLTGATFRVTYQNAVESAAIYVLAITGIAPTALWRNPAAYIRSNTSASPNTAEITGVNAGNLDLVFSAWVSFIPGIAFNYASPIQWGAQILTGYAGGAVAADASIDVVGSNLLGTNNWLAGWYRIVSPANPSLLVYPNSAPPSAANYIGMADVVRGS